LFLRLNHIITFVFSPFPDPLPVNFFQKKKWKKRKQTNNAVNAQQPKGNGIIGGDPFTGRKPFMPSLLVGRVVAGRSTLAAFLSISYEKGFHPVRL
jgi:hypothetical protein